MDQIYRSQLLRAAYSQQGPVVILPPSRDRSRPTQGLYLEFAHLLEVAEAESGWAWTWDPQGETGVFLTDDWGRRIGGLVVLNGLIAFAWIDPAFRRQGYFTAAFDLLQAQYPALEVADTPNMAPAKRLAEAFLAARPDRAPQDPDLQSQQHNPSSPFPPMQMSGPWGFP